LIGFNCRRAFDLDGIDFLVFNDEVLALWNCDTISVGGYSSVAREQPDAIPVAQVEDAKAVVLDFVNPTGPAGGSFTDFGRQSAMAESSRGNTERDMG